MKESDVQPAGGQPAPAAGPGTQSCPAAGCPCRAGTEHRRFGLTAAVAELRTPLLVVRGRGDPLSIRVWARRLAAAGCYVEVDGQHTFCWRDPQAWAGPIRAFAR